MIRRFWPVLGLVVVSALQVACSGNEAPAEDYKPATIEQVEGTDLSRVILTAPAAERLGLKVEALREEPTGAATNWKQTGKTVIPAAALLYDTEGAAWVYVAVIDPANAVGTPLTFQRHGVTVARIQADLAFLSSGPPVGTLVVIVGAAELLGAENGVEGE